jgi:hypothetical protein
MLGAAPDHHVADVAVVNVLTQSAHAHVQQLCRLDRPHQLFGVHPQNSRHIGLRDYKVNLAFGAIRYLPEHSGQMNVPVGLSFHPSFIALL